MKRLRLALALLFVCTMCALPARADSPSGWERVQQELGLNSDQMRQLKPIMEDYRKMRRGRIDALSTQIRSLLSPDQRARFDAMKGQRGSSPGDASPAPRPHGLKEFISSLSLSTDQIGKLQQMLRDNMSQARADHERFVEQVKPLLNSEQFARFQEMTKRRSSEGS